MDVTVKGLPISHPPQPNSINTNSPNPPPPFPPYHYSTPFPPPSPSSKTNPPSPSHPPRTHARTRTPQPTPTPTPSFPFYQPSAAAACTCTIMSAIPFLACPTSRPALPCPARPSQPRAPARLVRLGKEESSPRTFRALAAHQAEAERCSSLTALLRGRGAGQGELGSRRPAGWLAGCGLSDSFRLRCLVRYGVLTRGEGF